MLNSILIMLLGIALIVQSWSFYRYMKSTHYIIDQIYDKLAKINLEQSRMKNDIESTQKMNGINYDWLAKVSTDVSAIKYLLSKLKIQSFGKQVSHDRTFGDALHRIGITQVKERRLDDDDR